MLPHYDSVLCEITSFIKKFHLSLQLRKREMGCGQAPSFVLGISLQTMACFDVGVQVDATHRLCL